MGNPSSGTPVSITSRKFSNVLKQFQNLEDKADDLLPGTCIDILSSIHTSHHLLPRITVGKSSTAQQREEEAEDVSDQAHTVNMCFIWRIHLHYELKLME